MALVEPLIEIAKANGCTDLEACRKVVRSAAEEQRSLIQSILDSRLVDETGFLKGVNRLPGFRLRCEKRCRHEPRFGTGSSRYGKKIEISGSRSMIHLICSRDRL